MDSDDLNLSCWLASRKLLFVCKGNTKEDTCRLLAQGNIAKSTSMRTKKKDRAANRCGVTDDSISTMDVGVIHRQTVPIWSDSRFEQYHDLRPSPSDTFRKDWLHLLMCGRDAFFDVVTKVLTLLDAYLLCETVDGQGRRAVDVATG